MPAKRLSSRLKAEGSLTVFDFPNLQRKLTKWKAIAFSGKLLLSVESYCFQWKAIAFRGRKMRKDRGHGNVTIDCYEL